MKIRTKVIIFLSMTFILLGTSVCISSTWTISSILAQLGGHLVSAQLVHLNHTRRPNIAGAYLDKTTHASENLMTVNHYEYARVILS
ncbi:hypothetical protein [Dellaglioa carnosa]|uniref:hypothetical protein n=1 Tax=Dellaglioa carnosa TaxID=2995136 RepID=UPI0022A86D31|nr:hypothetical protein [Dellaglioa carnosa]MCZ2493544.1 hypothetical protein [Dellaglioa carnosa]